MFSLLGDIGHRFGVGSDTLLGYRDARYRIYLPAYKWVLENRLADSVTGEGSALAARAISLL